MIFRGVIPAAGSGLRLKPSRVPKELLPVLFERTDDGAGLVPRAVVEHSVDAMRVARVESALIVVSPEKWEVLRYLQNGDGLGIPLAYVVQSEPRGLAAAVDQAHAWLAQPGVVTCLALPDTVFDPVDALSIMRDRMIAQSADLVLGVFPSADAVRLGPVEIGSDGEVLQVHDKPAVAPTQNSWGLACWTSTFAELVHAKVQQHEGSGATEELGLGELFNLAGAEGLSRVAVEFPDGWFRDVGTPQGLAEFLEWKRLPSG